MNKTDPISTRLRDCRERCALTQLQVSRALNIDRSTYSYYELGHTQPSLETIVKLAEIFRVPVETLLPEQKAHEAVFDSKSTPIYQLSKEERGLLVSYRVLDPDQKDEVLKKINEMIKKNA